MNLPAKIVTDATTLPALVDRAAQTLASARNAAEILEAREMAGFAYDVAKRVARLEKAKGAHDEVIASMHRAQADALEIEAHAKRRLADEYDAAQEGGEVQKHGRVLDVGDEDIKLPTLTDLGIDRRDMHDARVIRDGLVADTDLVRRTNDEAVAAGKEPNRARILKAAKKATGKRPAPPKPTKAPGRGKDAIAQTVREAITALDGLPPPEQVVGYFEGSDYSMVIDEHIEAALQWLVAFSQNWSNRNA